MMIKKYVGDNKKPIKSLVTIFGMNPMMLIKEWCTCDEDDIAKWIFKDNGECRCGVIGHHYHCDKCGRITQTG